MSARLPIYGKVKKEIPLEEAPITPRNRDIALRVLGIHKARLERKRDKLRKQIADIDSELLEVK